MQSIISRYKSLFTFLAGIIVIAGIAFAFFHPDAAEGNQLPPARHAAGRRHRPGSKAMPKQPAQFPAGPTRFSPECPTSRSRPPTPQAAFLQLDRSVMIPGLPPSSLLAMMMVGFFILLIVSENALVCGTARAIAYGFSSYFIIIIGAGHLAENSNPRPTLPPWTIARHILLLPRTLPCRRRRYMPRYSP